TVTPLRGCSVSSSTTRPRISSALYLAGDGGSPKSGGHLEGQPGRIIVNKRAPPKNMHCRRIPALTGCVTSHVLKTRNAIHVANEGDKVHSPWSEAKEANDRLRALCHPRPGKAAHIRYLLVAPPLRCQRKCDAASHQATRRGARQPRDPPRTPRLTPGCARAPA